MVYAYRRQSDRDLKRGILFPYLPLNVPLILINDIAMSCKYVKCLYEM